jgi:hypothetical protein
MSSLLHTQVERDALASYADLMQRLQVPQAAGNWSGTATRLLQKMTAHVGRLVGFAVGHSMLGPIGGFAGMEAGAKVATTAQNAANVRRIQKQMPLLANAWGRWQKAANRALSANAPPNAGLQVGLATNQVDRILRGMHPSLGLDKFRAAAGHDQQQQNEANPPPQRHTGGRVEKQDEVFDPRSIGARQARDGHWRVPDQSRLRKYLTPTPEMRRRRWPGLLAAAGRLDQRLRRA